MTDAEFEQLIGPYLAGELDGETSARVQAYLDASPGRQGIVAGIRAAARSEDVGVAPEVSASRQRLMERLAGEEGEAARRRFPGVVASRVLRGGRGGWGSWTLRRWLGGATAAGILAAILLMARRGATPGSEPDAGVTQTYTTTEHQQAAVTLDDSTRVMLMPNTTVRLAHFSARSRMVMLERGEAYFRVMRVSTTPFFVRSDAMMARVLGTEFLVRHDVGDAGVRVAVVSGKVGVSLFSRPDSVVALTHGQVGEVRDSTVQVNTVRGAASGVEWKPGQFLFQDTPVATILQTLTRWYGYRFRYADHTLAQRGVTVVVSMQSSAEALEALEQVLAVNVTVVGDTVTLTPRPVRSPHSTPRTRSYDVWMPTREVGR